MGSLLVARPSCPPWLLVGACRPLGEILQGCILLQYVSTYLQPKIVYNEGVRHQTPQKCVFPKISWAVLKPTAKKVDRNIQHAFLNHRIAEGPRKAGMKAYQYVVPAETATATTPTPISPTFAMTDCYYRWCSYCTRYYQ